MAGGLRTGFNLLLRTESLASLIERRVSLVPIAITDHGPDERFMMKTQHGGGGGVHNQQAV